VRIIAFNEVVEAVRALSMKAACDLPDDVLDALLRAGVEEKSPQGKAILQ
jgi:tartrate dehydratase alpha subunit/fumarate hydratase class I-like protein